MTFARKVQHTDREGKLNNDRIKLTVTYIAGVRRGTITSFQWFVFPTNIL